jgi:hypothetical protein
MYSGQQPEFNHQISFSLRWGGEKGRAFGSDVAAKPAPVKKEPVLKKELIPATTTVMKNELTPQTTTTAVTPVQQKQDIKPIVTPAAVNVPATAPKKP